uniref:Shisa family member 9 n=1 Tax=Chrysemys picta bellii TaxID=8478 RepID=A0A8C3IDT2_CHRPI
MGSSSEGESFLVGRAGLSHRAREGGFPRCLQISQGYARSFSRRPLLPCSAEPAPHPARSPQPHRSFPPALLSSLPPHSPCPLHPAPLLLLLAPLLPHAPLSIPQVPLTSLRSLGAAGAGEPARQGAARRPAPAPAPARADQAAAGASGLSERVAPRPSPCMFGSWRSAAASSSRGGGGGIAAAGLGGRMKGFLRLALGCLVADLLTLVCRAQEKAGQHLGSIVVLSGGNHSSLGEHGDASEPPPTPDFCRGYFDVMGQWDPPFNCSSGEFVFCCGTCGFRFCCKFKRTRLDQSTCTNYETPVWMNTGKPPARIDDPLHDPTRDKTNLIVYIICGVVAVMVLVGIFTKLGLEKAHRPQREHMSRALADVMRPQGPCTTDHMERDLNIVVHVQHYENMEARPPANNLRQERAPSKSSRNTESERDTTRVSKSEHKDF